MRFNDRYATAIRASNLRSEAVTDSSNVDVIGAAGLASKEHPLAIALLRLFLGDNHASVTIVDILTSMLIGKAYRMGHEIDRGSARQIAQQVLDWFRDATCKVCAGQRYERIEGAPVVGNNICKACRGTGLRDVDRLFALERVELGRWLVAEIERETAKAGPAAMEKLGPHL